MYEELIQALQLHCEAGEKIGLSGAIWTLLDDASTALKSMTAQLAAIQSENAEKDKRIARVEAERDAASNTKLELFFGRGELGVYTVAEDEDSPLREILIRRLQSPVIPIGSALGDKGKTVDELENILVRMHFENVESALVLERALRIVLGSFEEPRRGAQGEG